jgi:hypothetical protein
MKRRLTAVLHGFIALTVLVTPLLAPLNADAARAGSAHCPTGKTLFGRAECIGYFSGSDVYSNGGIKVDNIIDNGGKSLMNVTNVDNFVSTIRSLLYGSDWNDNFGAAFIVDTMLNRKGTSFTNRTSGVNYAKSNFATWEQRVRSYSGTPADGRKVNYNQLVNFTAPFQNSGRSTQVYNDDIFYMKQEAESQRTIVFTNPNGTKFEIKKNCGNLVGTPSPLVAAPEYELTPDIGVDINNGDKTGDVVQVGDTIKFTYTIENESNTVSASATCTIYGGNYTGYHAVPDPYDRTNSGYTPPSCPTRTYPANTTVTVATETFNVTTANQSICRTLVVNPYAANKGDRDIEVCLYVAAQPYLKVFGGDVSAGNGISSGNSSNCTPNTDSSITAWNKGATTFAGAGTQFATMALGTIEDFATGQRTTGVNVPSGLAFANNAPNSDDFGGAFGSLPCIPDYYALKPTTTQPVTANVSSMGSGAYGGTGNVTLSGGTVNPGQRTTVYVQGNVYITGNITYTPNWSFRNIPLMQLIVKGNIYVGKDVTQLDGVYIAQPDGANGGNIYSCATGFAAPALDGTLYSKCNKKLTVNGLFSAKQVQLMRTNGTISQSSATESRTSNNAAEVFNYNPSVWIAQPAFGSNTGNTKAGDYDSITSLPPVL